MLSVGAGLSAADLMTALTQGETSTAVLTRLFGTRPRAVKQPLAAPDEPPPPALAQCFAAPAASLAHRRIVLMLGSVPAARADLWYRPDLLLPGMVRLLAETDQPFGGVVASLHPWRETLAARLLPPGGADVLEIEAAVHAGTEVIAVARETYAAALTG